MAWDNFPAPMPLLLTLVFVLSGAAGLIYESIWSRYLGLFVGHSAYAQVIVLVIYLGGMSVGAAIAARYSERIKEPLIMYTVAEIVVGFIGLFFHVLFRAVSDVAYSSIFPALAGGGALVIVKWMIAGLLILPQSVLLGTTFPLMSAGLLRRVSSDGATDTGRVLSVLYFANSIGAAVGVLVAGFYLIGAVGLPGTLLTAAVINLLVGLIVFGAVRLEKDNDDVPEPPPARLDSPIPGSSIPGASDPSLPQLWRVLLIVAAGTALASFIYEIAWVRMLSLVLGSATHSFELMLSAFILGLALGAYWVRSRADTFRDPLRALGITQWAMGALAIVTLGAYLASFDWMAALIQGLDTNIDGYHFFSVAKYGIALSVMLPATFCAGITLPLITRMLMAAGGGEKAIGAVYSVNTLGSIVGAALAALVLMPLLGMKALLVTGGAIDMILGVWLLFLSGKRQARHRTFVVAFTGATVFMMLYAVLFVPFDRGILISGVYRYGRVPAVGRRSIVFYKDGRTATVSVRKGDDGNYSLATNGKPDASLSPTWFLPDSDSSVRPLEGDESTQVLLPLITLAHVPNAKRGAVIGNGSGMSSHLLLGSPAIEKLVTIDIEPEMINGSHTFYPVNRRVFDDPRAQYVHDDAKSYFASTNRTFDLILSEPSNPWVSGVSGLFTDEFYQRVRTYLTPNGVFGQWLHLYEIDDELVLSVIKAIHRNFRSYQIYLTADVDMLIVASNQPELPKPDWSIFALTAIAKDLRHFATITPELLDRTRLASRATFAPLLVNTQGANSDFYPELDLHTERSRYMKQVANGFYGLADGRFDVGSALLGDRILPSSETDPHVNIVRIKSQALGARLRAGETVPPDNPDNSDHTFRAAAGRYQLLRQMLAANNPPADWTYFFKLATDVDSDIHSGTMGWSDDAFYASVTKFLYDQHAPVDARAAWRFLHAVTGYDWAAAAVEIDPVLNARVNERSWLDNDLFRDAAVTTLLHTGNIAKARMVFDKMGEFSARKAEDLRVKLLGAHLVAKERK